MRFYRPASLRPDARRQAAGRLCTSVTTADTRYADLNSFSPISQYSLHVKLLAVRVRSYGVRSFIAIPFFAVYKRTRQAAASSRRSARRKNTRRVRYNIHIRLLHPKGRNIVPCNGGRTPNKCGTAKARIASVLPAPTRDRRLSNTMWEMSRTSTARWFRGETWSW